MLIHVPPEGAEWNRHQAPVPRVVFYSDPEVNGILGIEALLSRCDVLDLRILDGLRKSVPYGALTEELSRSENTVKYRIKRMPSRIGRETREEMLALLDGYLADDAFAKAMEIRSGRSGAEASRPE